MRAASAAGPSLCRPKNLNTEMASARAHFVRGDHAAALAQACAVLKNDARSFEAHLLLGELALPRTGGGPVAEKLFRSALALRPNQPDAERMLANALSAQGRWREAGDLLARTLRTRPRDLANLLALAKVRELDGQNEAAENALSIAVKYHPHASTTAAALGDMLKRRGRLREALVWHRRSVGSSELDLPTVTAGRRHVIFLVQQGGLWDSAASVYAAFAADPGWKATIIALPFQHCQFSTDKERNAVFEFLQEKGIPYVRWDEFKLAPGCADVVFMHLPYEETRPSGWSNSELLSAVPRIVYVSYAVPVLASGENNQFQFNLPLQQRAWMVIAHSRHNQALFVRHCATGAAHVVVTGHPKVDAVCDRKAGQDDELARLVGDRKLIFWNPHFDMRPDGTIWGSGCSTFMRWQEFFLEEFSKRPELMLLVRPHPLFFSSLQSRKLWSAAQVAAFHERIQQAGNILVDHRPSYLPAFKASAALLSDASSLLLEYSVTGKPVLYLHNPRGPGINDAEFVREHLYTGSEEKEIRDFLDMVARSEDPRGPARRIALPDFMHRPPEGAGIAVKRAIEARIDQESASPLSDAMSPPLRSELFIHTS
jgi:Tfp pilus assembly protein PilF